MADEVKPPRRTNLLLGVLLGAAIAILGVLGFLYYQQQRNVVTIDVPGFSGKITKDLDGPGFSGKIGKDKGVDVRVD
jgi:hypothetical protein